MALMADGVPADEVYEVLGDRRGRRPRVRQARHDQEDVVWWEAGAQPPQLLADGEVAMTTAYNGRLFNAIVEENKPFEIVWDGQVWDFDLWGIPKGSDGGKTAWDFVEFATDTQRLADQAKWISYGPARKSSMALVGRATSSRSCRPRPRTCRTRSMNNFEWWADNAGRHERAVQRLARPVGRLTRAGAGAGRPASVPAAPEVPAMTEASAAYPARDHRRRRAAADQAAARRAARAAARLGLVLPLFAFILITFFVPIVVMLLRSVENPLLADNFPNTLAQLKDWDPKTTPLPPEPVFAAFAAEMAAAAEAKTIGQVATRVNYEQSGTRSLFTKTARQRPPR